jgi:hypothetical protein
VKRLLVSLVLAVSTTIALAQAAPTATRSADLQVGASFALAKPDCTFLPAAPSDCDSFKFKGYGFYADLDLKYHLGIELDFHDVKGQDPIAYERTYEVGPRYIFPIHRRFVPYVKAMYGRGVFNFPGYLSTPGGLKEVTAANLAFNIFSGGGGLDVMVLPGLNIRVIDFEYQRWGNFPPKAINPAVLSFGVAYHFHGGDRYSR